MRSSPTISEVSVSRDIVIPGADNVKPAQNGGGDNTEATATTTAKKATADATAATTDAADTSVMIPVEGQIYISEIMFAGGGFLPQWIEISNGSICDLL